MTKSVYLDDDLIQAIQKHADRHGRSFSWAVRDLCRGGLEIVRAPIVTDVRAEYERRLKTIT